MRNLQIVGSRNLTEAEREAVLALLRSPRFVDRSPGQVVAILLDEGLYLCSESTMYRLLRQSDEVRDRRRQAQHPEYIKPKLLATAPKQCWSWDITKLRGPHRGEWYAVLVKLDIFSRMVVGWTLVRRADAKIASEFIAGTVEAHGIGPGTLTIHADRGAEMTAQLVGNFLERLALRRSHSRPHVSDDNPYSEAQFKTMKYAADVPNRLAALKRCWLIRARSSLTTTAKHRHSGIAVLTPAEVHAGTGSDRLAQRHASMRAAFENRPERFVNGAPKRQSLPDAVWINPPSDDLRAA